MERTQVHLCDYCSLTKMKTERKAKEPTAIESSCSWQTEERKCRRKSSTSTTVPKQRSAKPSGQNNACSLHRLISISLSFQIRIFAYAVGPTANPIAAVKWIACTNRGECGHLSNYLLLRQVNIFLLPCLSSGYFYRIPAMGAIRSTVQVSISGVIFRVESPRTKSFMFMTNDS